MAKLEFGKFEGLKPGFFDYLAKILMMFGAWIILFSLVYVNMRLYPFLTTDSFLYLVGIGFLSAILIISGGVYLLFFDYPTFSRNKNLLLLLVAFCLTALSFEICVSVPLNVYLLPISGIAMLRNTLTSR